MSQDDVLFGFRLRVFTLAEELGSVTAACRAMGIDRSTYGEKVQLDCFFVGRLTGTKGRSGNTPPRTSVGLRLGRATRHRAKPPRALHARAAAPRLPRAQSRRLAAQGGHDR